MEKYDCRAPFSQAVLDVAKGDDRVVVVCNDSVSSSSMGEFQKLYPDRLINVGIAEQNMIGVAAGLANAGLIPIVCAASCFLSGRAYEQIKVDIGYSNANVKLFGVSPGFAYGALGATHHSPEDVALLHTVPGISVAVPSDPAETKSATLAAIKHIGPTFVRVLRTPVCPIPWVTKSFQFGQSEIQNNGRDVVFIANGLAVHHVAEAARLLSYYGIGATIINASSVRPIDKSQILRAAASCTTIVTVEEGSLIGGLGSIVSRILGEASHGPILQLGVEQFAPTGSTSQILEHFSLDGKGIARSVLEFAKRTGVVFPSITKEVVS